MFDPFHLHSGINVVGGNDETTTTTTTTNTTNLNRNVNNNNNNSSIVNNTTTSTSSNIGVRKDDSKGLIQQLEKWRNDFYEDLEYDAKKVNGDLSNTGTQVPSSKKPFTDDFSNGNQNNNNIMNPNGDLLKKRIKQWQFDIHNEIEQSSYSFIGGLPDRVQEFHRQSRERHPLFLTPSLQLTSPSSVNYMYQSNLSPIGSAGSNNSNSSNGSSGNNSVNNSNQSSPNIISQQQHLQPISSPIQITKFNNNSINNNRDQLKQSTTDDLESNFQTWRILFNDKMDQNMIVKDIRSHSKIQIN